MMMDVTPRKIKTVGLKNICTNKRNGACGMCKLAVSETNTMSCDNKDSPAAKLNIEHIKTPHRTPKRNVQYRNLFSSPILYDGTDKTPERHVGWDDGTCDALIDAISPRIPRKRTRRCPEFVLQRNAKSMPVSASEIEKEDNDMRQFAELANSLLDLPSTNAGVFESSDNDDSLFFDNSVANDSLNDEVVVLSSDDPVTQKQKKSLSEDLLVTAFDTDVNHNRRINDPITDGSKQETTMVTPIVSRKKEDRHLPNGKCIRTMCPTFDVISDKENHPRSIIGTQVRDENSKEVCEPNLSPSPNKLFPKVTEHETTSSYYDSLQRRGQVTDESLLHADDDINSENPNNNVKFSKKQSPAVNDVPESSSTASIVDISTLDTVVIDLLDDSSNDMIMLCTQAAEEKFLSENPSVVAEYNNKYVKQEETMHNTFKTRKGDFAKEQPSVKEEEEHVCEYYPQTRNNKFTSLDEKKIDITLLEDSQQDTCGSQNVNREEQSKFHSLTKNKFLPAVRLEIPSFRPSIKPNNGTTYYVSNSSTTQHSAEQIDLTKSVVCADSSGGNFENRNQNSKFNTAINLLTASTELLKSLQPPSVQDSIVTTSRSVVENTASIKNATNLLLDDSSDEIMMLWTQAAEEKFLSDINKDTKNYYDGQGMSNLTYIRPDKDSVLDKADGAISRTEYVRDKVGRNNNNNRYVNDDNSAESNDYTVDLNTQSIKNGDSNEQRVVVKRENGYGINSHVRTNNDRNHQHARGDVEVGVRQSTTAIQRIINDSNTKQRVPVDSDTSHGQNMSTGNNNNNNNIRSIASQWIRTDNVKQKVKGENSLTLTGNGNSYEHTFAGRNGNSYEHTSAGRNGFKQSATHWGTKEDNLNANWIEPHCKPLSLTGTIHVPPSRLPCIETSREPSCVNSSASFQRIKPVAISKPAYLNNYSWNDNYIKNTKPPISISEGTQNNDNESLLEEENEIFQSLNFDHLESPHINKPEVKPTVVKTYSNVEIEKRRMEARQKLLQKYASYRNV